jgi:hypothetical protein
VQLHMALMEAEPAGLCSSATRLTRLFSLHARYSCRIAGKAYAALCALGCSRSTSIDVAVAQYRLRRAQGTCPIGNKTRAVVVL